MDPLFLRQYNSELQYLREMGGEFAKEFPKIAGRLGLDEFECADPYVERLLEGVAFLTARVQRKMEAEFPRFTQHLLEMIYPDYLAPTPSMAVVQFHPDYSEGGLLEGYVIPRHTRLRGQLTRDQQTACEYVTGHETTLWPLEIVGADYFGRNVAAIGLPAAWQTSTKAGLRIRLRCPPGVEMNQLKLDRLPIFLQGDEYRSLRLYEQIFAHAQSVLIRVPQTKELLATLDRSALQRVGFADDEALLPVNPRGFSGYRLVHEYFAFHHRFLFFEVRGLQAAIQACRGPEIELVILFKRSDSQLENVVDASHFGLYCTPAINLFPTPADRIHLDYAHSEFHVVPDRTRPLDLELHSITSAAAFGEDMSRPIPLQPFYSLTSRDERPEAAATAYYTIRRDPRMMSSNERQRGPRTSYIGSESFVSVVDVREAPFHHELKQIDLRVLCTNRDLPLLMPLGAGSTDFTLNIGAPVQSIRCVAGPSPPRPPLVYGAGSLAWRLISHLSLNYLSLVDADETEGATALRELLSLYADPMASDLRKQIEGLRHVQSKSVVRRVPTGGPITFGRGIEITLMFEEAAFEGYGCFLLGAVLAHFFTQYVTLNSFTETVLRSSERGEITRWPAKIGQRHLI